MEKLRLNYIFGLAGEHCFGFGKFNKDGSSRRPPRTPTGFNHHGSKSEALVRAEAFGGQVVALEVFVLRDCRARVLDSRRNIAKTTGNGEVERNGGAAAPPWQVDVRGPPGVRRSWSNPVFWERTLQGARLEEPWLFEFWVETSNSGEVENRVSKKIVPFRAVTPTRADEAMVAESVEDAIAKRTDPIRFCERNSEPPKNTSPEQKWVDFVLMTGRRTCMKPHASSGSPGKLQVSPASGVCQGGRSLDLV